MSSLATPVKNTFLHFVEDDYQESSGNTLKRQYTEPAPSMPRQVSVSSQIDSPPMHMDMKTIKLWSPSTGACEDPSFFSEPEGEPSSFSRQISLAFSDDDFRGGLCRQETEQAWPTWVARPQMDPMLAAPLMNPQVPWVAAATLPSVPLPPVLPPLPPTYPAPLALGMLSTPSPCTKFEALAVEEKSNEEEAKPTAKSSKGLPRSRRKNKSLITLAHQAQLREHKKQHQQDQQLQQSVQGLQPQDMPKPAGIDVAEETLRLPTDESLTSRCNFCPYCGGGLEAHFKFCLFCGTSVTTIRGSLGMESEC